MNNTDVPNNPEDLVQLFALDPERYTNLTHFVDNTIGFSVQRTYPETPLFQPILARNGQPDEVALIRAVARKEINAADGRIPVRLDIGSFSRYLCNHTDYSEDPSVAESPDPEEVPGFRRKAKPMNLIAMDNLFLSDDGKHLEDKDGNTVSGTQSVDNLYNDHVATLRPLQGALLRRRQRALPRLAERVYTRPPLLARIAKSILSALGRNLEEDPEIASHRKGYRRTQIKLTSPDKLSILGYDASKNAVILFGVLVVLTALLGIWVPAIESTLMALSRTLLLSVGTSIVLLALLDVLVPALALKVLNWSIMRQWKRFGTSRPVRRGLFGIRY